MNLFTKNKAIHVLFLSLLVCIMTAACSNISVPKESSGHEKIKLVADKDKVYVGFILDTLRDERWYNDKEAFEKEVAKLGGNVKTLAANGLDDVQIKQAELLIAEGVDVLVVVPHNGEIAAPIVELAHQAGIKVISYDRLIRNAEVDYYVSFDNQKVGELQATEITKSVPTGNYVYIGGAESDNNAKLLRNGTMSVLQPLVDRGEIQIIFDQYTDDWDPSVATKNMQSILASHPGQIDAVIAANDGTAGGVIEALEGAGLAGIIPVSGQDAETEAINRIKAGTQTMTVQKPIEIIAAQAAQMAVKIATGETITTEVTVNNGEVEVPSILLESIAITKENVN